MASKIGDLFYRITGNTAGLDSSLKKSNKNVKTFGTGIKGLDSLLKKVGFAFVAKKIADIGLSAINAASDAEETANKFNVVFSDISNAAEDAAENLSDNFGLSSNAAKTLLSDTGDLLTGFGFTQESALDLSDQVNQLAVDLASFTNFSGGAEGASQALTKALLGERESVKALGISILEEDVKKQVALNTTKGLVFETERQAKAQATLDIALSQSKNAIGDFARSSDSFANQQKIATSAVEDLRTEIGKNLLPAATESIKIFAGVTRAVADFVAERNRLREIEEAAATGKGSIDDQIAGLNIQIQTLKKVTDNRAAGFEMAQKYGRELNSLAVAQQESDLKEIQLIQQKIEGLRLESRAIGDKTQAQKEELEEEAKQNKIEEERLLKQKEYIEYIKTEYSGTEQAKLEQLKQELDLIEKNIDSYGGLRKEQLLLIEQKKEEIEAIEDQLAVNDEYTDSVLQGVADRQAARFEEQNQEELFAQAIEERNARIAQSEYDLLMVRGQAYATFFGSVSSLISAFGIQSKNQFIASQAFASAEAAINSYLAFTQVLADPSFIGRPFTRAIAAGGVLAAGLAQQVNILSTPMPAFANGGIVPGNSFSGDNVLGRLNSDEMILNKQQQTELFKIANGGGSGQTINLVVDGKTLATVVVDNVNNGKGGTINSRVIR